MTLTPEPSLFAATEKWAWRDPIFAAFIKKTKAHRRDSSASVSACMCTDSHTVRIYQRHRYTKSLHWEYCYRNSSWETTVTMALHQGSVTDAKEQHINILRWLKQLGKIKNKHAHPVWMDPGSRPTSLCLFAGILAACTYKPFVWDSKPGVTSYILLYEPVLKRADKSFREDVWSTQDDKQHTVQSLWDPGPKRRQDSGLSIISSDPGRLGGSQQRASTDSRGWKKVTIVHNAGLEENMRNASLATNLQC